jgi:hypothetical protein
MGKSTMNHPEGRILAIQQQMFFAQILAEKMDMETETILRKLAIAGLSLSMDTNEVAVDAAAILPNLPKWRSRLRAVPDIAGDL